MNFKKNVCDVYHFNTDSSLWATIYVNDNGQLSILSDYGEWAYWWYSFGDDFKSFLCGINRDYVIEKLSNGHRELNFEKTIANLKNDIVEYRNDDLISSEEANDYWDGVSNIPYCDDVDLFLFEFALHCGEMYGKMYDGNPVPYVKEYGHHICSFIDKFWGEFVEVLKQEEN